MTRKWWTGAAFAQDDAICTSFPQFSLLLFMHIHVPDEVDIVPRGGRKQANLDMKDPVPCASSAGHFSRVFDGGYHVLNLADCCYVETT